MTIIAGALSRDGRPLRRELRAALVGNVSRHAADRATVLGSDRWLLAKVDVGAFGAPALIGCDDGPALVVAGEPLLLREPAFANRAEECAELLRGLLTGSSDVLRESSGAAFCGALYDQTGDRILLFGDRLGLRPVYYAVLEDALVFASAMRILEDAGVAIGLDRRGTYEICAFGFPLADRTAYSNVSTIGAGEIVELSRSGVVRRPYFSWTEALRERQAFEHDAAVTTITDAFMGAVRRRLRNDRHVLSFLSGGLDSRTIVAALRHRGVVVSAANFAPAESQDRRFAELAAQALGVHYRQLEVPLSSVISSYRQEQLREWVESLQGADRPDRSGLVWSGDGGSVGLGHVYMDPTTVKALADSGDGAAVQSFVRYNRISGAANLALADAFRHECRTWHVQGMLEELDALRGVADGRRLWLFLMLNDQRRHLAGHFESIDKHRFEFHLPFFDAEFLLAVGRFPVEPFLHHRFYHEWLAELDPAAVSVPWQTYPGHQPCPINVANTLRYQWNRETYFGRAEERKAARARGREALRLVTTTSVPSGVVSRLRVGVAAVSSMLGWEEYSHVVRVGSTFLRACSVVARAKQAGSRHASSRS